LRLYGVAEHIVQKIDHVLTLNKELRDQIGTFLTSTIQTAQGTVDRPLRISPQSRSGKPLPKTAPTVKKPELNKSSSIAKVDFEKSGLLNSELTQLLNFGKSGKLDSVTFLNSISSVIANSSSLTEGDLYQIMIHVPEKMNLGYSTSELIVFLNSHGNINYQLRNVWTEDKILLIVKALEKIRSSVLSEQQQIEMLELLQNEIGVEWKKSTNYSKEFKDNTITAVHNLYLKIIKGQRN
jgi:hypothetical protein